MFRRNYCFAPGNKGRHFYSSETHQCACGHWERGFKPKTEPTLDRDECQICERQQALRHGTMVQHGYKRPGIGFILGGCPGVHRKPFPATDALKSYLILLGRQNVHLHERLKELEGLPVIDWTIIARTGYGKREEKTIQIRPGDETSYVPNDSRPSYETAHRITQERIETELKHLAREITRVETRIKKGQEILAASLAP